MALPVRQRRALLLHLGLFGLPHALVAFVIVTLFLRDVLHQYGGGGAAPGWAGAWFGSASLIAITWGRLALRGWRGGVPALRSAPVAWWVGLAAAIAATAVAWAGLVRSIFHIPLVHGPALAAVLILLAGIPLLSCAAHLLWLRWRAK